MSTGSIESAAIATDWSKTILRGYVELPIARGSAMRGGGGTRLRARARARARARQRLRPRQRLRLRLRARQRRRPGPRRKRDGRNTRRCPARLSFRGPSAGSVPYELVSSSGPFAVRARIYLNSSYCSPPRLWPASRGLWRSEEHQTSEGTFLKWGQPPRGSLSRFLERIHTVVGHEAQSVQGDLERTGT